VTCRLAESRDRFRDVFHTLALDAERRGSPARAATPGLSTTPGARRLNALVRRFLIAHSAPFNPNWRRSGAMRRDAVKHTFDTDVLIDIRPMNPLTRPDETEMRPLLGRSLR
jgi:hypothetical protein